MSFPIKNNFYDKNIKTIIFTKNNFSKPFFKNFLIKLPIYNNISNTFFKKLANILYLTFFFNKNIIFIDHNHNYNYLPITNKVIFNRSIKNIFKLFKFFRVGVVCYLDFGKKDFFLTKLLRFKYINISLNNSINHKNMDLNLNLPNSKLANYIIYIFIMNLYLKIKI